jgi:HEPN domain-containing protein
MHLAVEKSIKVLLIQHGLHEHHHHDLHKLFDKARIEFSVDIDDQKIINMPTDKESNKYRYGEIAGTTSQYAISIYSDVIHIIKNTTLAMRRKFVMNNASMLIQFPPWECD